MKLLGVSFKQSVSSVPENLRHGEDAMRFTVRLAAEKAAAVLGADRSPDPGPVVLGADTVVEIDGNILGKPESMEEHHKMLRWLSGREHRVVTGVSVCSRETVITRYHESIVRFREIENTEIADYWATGEPQDKAGGYGLQGRGRIFVASITGSYTNVVGLPMVETSALLTEFGIPCQWSPARENDFILNQDSLHG